MALVFGGMFEMRYVMHMVDGVVVLKIEFVFWWKFYEKVGSLNELV